MAKGTNFGLKTRDLAKAGRFAVNEMARAGTMAYASAATLGQRWQAFAAYAKSYGEHQQHGSVDPHHLSLVRWRAAFAETALLAKAGGKAYCACGRPLPLQRWSVYQKARAAHA